jgi:osmotically-inducible protein OsmY
MCKESLDGLRFEASFCARVFAHGRRCSCNSRLGVKRLPTKGNAHLAAELDGARSLAIHSFKGGRMRIGRNLTGLAVILALVAVAVPGTWAVGAEQMDMAQKVEAAKTAADHEALAAQYDKEAADAKAKAAQHRTMGAAYKGSVAVSGGKGSGVSAMPQHCESIAKSFDEQAKMYSAMAMTERELAKAK